MSKEKLFDKDEVLHQAMDLFWKQGFHATSMQDLVAHLGISRSSLYDTFESKKNLFDLALELYCITNRVGTLGFLNNESSVKEGIKKLFEWSISCSTSNIDRIGCFAVNSVTELIPGDDEIKKALVKNKTMFENIFFDFLLSGQKSGEISNDKDLKVISSLLYTLFCGFSVASKITNNQKKLLAQVDVATCLLD